MKTLILLLAMIATPCYACEELGGCVVEFHGQNFTFYNEPVYNKATDKWEIVENSGEKFIFNRDARIYGPDGEFTVYNGVVSIVPDEKNVINNKGQIVDQVETAELVGNEWICTVHSLKGDLLTVKYNANRYTVK